LMDALWPGTWKQALTRVNALRKFPSDPRIAKKLPELLGRYDSLGAAPFRGEASALLRRMTKEQQGAAPEALLAEASKSSGGAVDLGALWDAVWSEPASDDRRAVLADALSAANDPRGEFISLSLAMSRGLTDPKARKRAAALLKDNIDAWTGNIPGAELGSRVFERGFLSRVRIVLSRPAELERSAAAKEWRTVEELFVDQNGYFHEAEASALAKVLPALVSLRALVIQRWAGDSFFKTLVDGGPFPAIRSLGSAEWPIDLKNTAFPSLELFGTMSKEPAVAMELARRFGARTVVLFVTDGRLADAVEELDGARIDELRVVLEGGYGQFLVPRNWTLRFRHGHDEVSLHPWSSRYEKGSIAGALERVRALKRKTVRIARPATGGADLEAEVASLTKSHKLEVRFDAEPMSLWQR
ncbi:MAG: hypothetical protein U0271_48190, partial [Polyangiaceae bacterium]